MDFWIFLMKIQNFNMFELLQNVYFLKLFSHTEKKPYQMSITIFCWWLKRLKWTTFLTWCNFDFRRFYFTLLRQENEFRGPRKISINLKIICKICYSFQINTLLSHTCSLFVAAFSRKRELTLGIAFVWRRKIQNKL